MRRYIEACHDRHPNVCLMVWTALSFNGCTGLLKWLTVMLAQVVR